MHIRKADGTYGEIDFTREEETTQRMYNLTVAEAHTFFVGDGQWLVHNVCAKGLSGKVVNDPYGEWLVDEAIRYHKAANSDEPITIAVGEYGGRKVVALNGRANPTTQGRLLKVTNAEGVELVYNPGSEWENHAEMALYNKYFIQEIGISNSTQGPCPDGCRPFFLNLQALGKFTELYYPALRW